MEGERMQTHPWKADDNGNAWHPHLADEDPPPQEPKRKDSPTGEPKGGMSKQPGSSERRPTGDAEGGE
jgi:hypothetical protein